MQHNDVLYYRHRAEVETGLAQQAQHPEAAAAHQQLATLYFARTENGDKPMLLGSD